MTGARILLLGKNGQVGWELQRSLAPLGELIALDRQGNTQSGLCGDLQDLEGLRNTVLTLKPTVVVNAAAYTAVDRAEIEPGLVQRHNADAPKALALAAEEIGAWLVQYSSDYVFDGSGSSPWTEDAPTRPLNAYGQAMRRGEQLVSTLCTRHLILRTSWVYSAKGNNFARTILRLAQEQERLTVVNDQVGAPTGADLVADVTAQAIRQAAVRPENAGTYHLAATGETSWFRYACFVIETARLLKPELKLAVRELVPVSSTEFATRAIRPHNSRLDTTRLRSTFDVYLPPWQTGLTRMLSLISMTTQGRT